MVASWSGRGFVLAAKLWGVVSPPEEDTQDGRALVLPERREVALRWV